MGMHKLPVDNFVVFYTVDGDSMTVTVIRIVYGGRDIESLAATDYEWARCKMEPVRTTRKTGGLHKPYKGIVLAAPQGAVKRSADRIGLRAAPPSGAAFICSF